MTTGRAWRARRDEERCRLRYEIKQGRVVRGEEQLSICQAASRNVELSLVPAGLLLAAGRPGRAVCERGLCGRNAQSRARRKSTREPLPFNRHRLGDVVSWLRG